jgi:hypothetical protein
VSEKGRKARLTSIDILLIIPSNSSAHMGPVSFRDIGGVGFGKVSVLDDFPSVHVRGGRVGERPSHGATGVVEVAPAIQRVSQSQRERGS